MSLIVRTSKWQKIFIDKFILKIHGTIEGGRIEIDAAERIDENTSSRKRGEFGGIRK